MQNFLTGSNEIEAAKIKQELCKEEDQQKEASTKRNKTKRYDIVDQEECE